VIPSGLTQTRRCCMKLPSIMSGLSGEWREEPREKGSGKCSRVMKCFGAFLFLKCFSPLPHL
jgi:hypothetical protein